MTRVLYSVSADEQENNNQLYTSKTFFMKSKYITLQILIAVKMNGKNNTLQPAPENSPATTHYIF